ncbi:hypothetical protein F5884DRAFT_349985 [Xylogone sp. PMI_703]|nr:hypothetical protein F5884DRAFT_349985 [Xylogone sp. PMI_703]
MKRLSYLTYAKTESCCTFPAHRKKLRRRGLDVHKNLSALLANRSKICELAEILGNTEVDEHLCRIHEDLSHPRHEPKEQSTAKQCSRCSHVETVGWRSSNLASVPIDDRCSDYGSFIPSSKGYPAAHHNPPTPLSNDPQSQELAFFEKIFDTQTNTINFSPQPNNNPGVWINELDVRDMLPRTNEYEINKIPWSTLTNFDLSKDHLSSPMPVSENSSSMLCTVQVADHLVELYFLHIQRFLPLFHKPSLRVSLQPEFETNYPDR